MNILRISTPALGIHFSAQFCSTNEQIIHELDQVGWELHYEAALQMRAIPQDAPSLNKGLIWTELNLHWHVKEDVNRAHTLSVQNDTTVD